MAKLEIGGKKDTTQVTIPAEQLIDKDGNVKGTPINIEITMPEKGKSKPIIRRVGEEHTGGETGAVTFLSKAKNLTVFRDGDDYIIFRNYIFQTDNPMNINFLRESPYYDIEIFEGQYPEHILKEIEDRNKFLTRDKEEHEA